MILEEMEVVPAAVAADKKIFFPQVFSSSNLTDFIMNQIFTRVLPAFLLLTFVTFSANAQSDFRMGLTGSGPVGGFQTQIPQTIMGLDMDFAQRLKRTSPLELGFRLNATFFGSESWQGIHVDGAGHAVAAEYQQMSHGVHLYPFLRFSPGFGERVLSPYLEVFGGPSHWGTTLTAYALDEGHEECPEPLEEYTLASGWTASYGAGAGFTVSPFIKNPCSRAIRFYAGAEYRQFGQAEVILSQSDEITRVSPRQLNFRMGISILFDWDHWKDCENCGSSCSSDW